MDRCTNIRGGGGRVFTQFTTTMTLATVALSFVSSAVATVAEKQPKALHGTKSTNWPPLPLHYLLSSMSSANTTLEDTHALLDIAVKRFRHSLVEPNQLDDDGSHRHQEEEEEEEEEQPPDPKEKDSSRSRQLSWYVKLLWSLLFYPMIVFAAAGNLLIIWILATKPLMQSIMNRYLLNLAISDFLSISFNASFNFVFMLNEHWPFGWTYCVFNNMFAIITLASSVFTMVLISLDRYYAIVHPLRPRPSHKRFLVSICLVWLLSSLFSVPTLLFSDTITIGGEHSAEESDGPRTNLTNHHHQHQQQQPHNNLENVTLESARIICMLRWPDGDQGFSQFDFIYNLAIFIAFYLIPLFILVISLVLMSRVLWPGERIGEHTSLPQDALIRSKRKVVYMLICVIGVFGVCWFPYHAYFLTAYWWPSIISQAGIKHVFLSFYWLAMANSLFNPIILFAMNRRIRNYILYYFKFTGCLLCYNSQQHLGHHHHHPHHHHHYHHRYRRHPPRPPPNSSNNNNNNNNNYLQRNAPVHQSDGGGGGGVVRVNGVGALGEGLRPHRESQLLESSSTPFGCSVQGSTGSKRRNNNNNNNNEEEGNNIANNVNEQMDNAKGHARAGTPNGAGHSQDNLAAAAPAEQPHPNAAYRSHPLDNHQHQHHQSHSKRIDKKLSRKCFVNFKRKAPNIELSKTFSSSSFGSADESDAERGGRGAEESSEMLETSHHHSCPPALCRPRSSQSSGSNSSSGRVSQHLGVPSVIHTHSGNDNILSFSECNLCSEYDWSSQKGSRRCEGQARQQQPCRATTRSPSVSSQSKLPRAHPPTSSHRLSGTFRFLFTHTRRFSAASQQSKLAKHDRHYNCYQFYNKRHRASEAGGHASAANVNRTMATGVINSVISTAL